MWSVKTLAFIASLPLYFPLRPKDSAWLERGPKMLLIGTMGWIIIAVAVVSLVAFIGIKIKDKYY